MLGKIFIVIATLIILIIVMATDMTGLFQYKIDTIVRDMIGPLLGLLFKPWVWLFAFVVFAVILTIRKIRGFFIIGKIIGVLTLLDGAMIINCYLNPHAQDFAGTFAVFLFPFLAIFTGVSFFLGKVLGSYFLRRVAKKDEQKGKE